MYPVIPHARESLSQDKINFAYAYWPQVGIYFWAYWLKVGMIF